MYFHSLALQEGWLSPLFVCVTVFVDRPSPIGNCGSRVTYPKRVTRAQSNIVTLNQRRTFLVAFGGVLVASRMYVSTSALFYHVTNEYLLLKNCIFHDFGILDHRTTEPFHSDSGTFFSNLRTFGLKNLRTHEPSNSRTFGLIWCNHMDYLTTRHIQGRGSITQTNA